MKIRVSLGVFSVVAGLALIAPASSLASPAPHFPILPPPVYGLTQARADRPDPVTRGTRPAPSAPVPSGTWQPLGPAPIGPPFLRGGGFYGGVNAGRTTGLVTIPSGAHAGRVVAATAGGGIWTSDDSGSTWAPRTDGSADLAIGSIAVDPSNANHLIAGTGEANQCGDCFSGVGILVSTDGGNTWAQQNPGGVFTGRAIAQVAIDSGNSNHQLAATNGGLYVTSDGGANWAKPSDPSYASVDGNITAVVVDPSTPANVYIGGGAARVAKSSDGGVTWSAANTGIGAPGATPLIALGIAPSSPSTLYVSVGSQSAVAVYKSTDSAASWTHLTAAPDFTGQAYSYGSGSGEQGWYDNVLAVDPSNPNHVLAGGIAAIETTDGGSTWTNVNGQAFFGGGTNKLHPDHHALAFAGDGTVWVGDDGGVFHYTPSSGTVVNANGNLNITQFYFGFNEVGGTLLAGAQDNASARTSSSSVGAWTGIFSGDGGPSAITANNSSMQFIQANQNLYVTTDAFATTFQNITPPQLGLFTPPVIVVPNSASPSTPSVFYGGPNLYRSTNPTGGSGSFTQVTSVGGATVSAIAASPSDPQVVYVGFTNGTIQVSTDGGATFTSLAAVTSPEVFVTGLSVDPSNSDAITASFSFNDTRYRPGLPHVQQYVWSGTPGAGTWTTITGSGLPAAVSRVAYDNGALVAATDAGVYATSAPAGGSTVWTSVGTGMPNVQVQDLFVDSGNGNLYVVTHGRGAWELPQTAIGPPSASITTPSDGAVFTQGQVVNASYSCQDDPGGPGISSCTGPVPNGSPIDTSTTGPHSFMVTARSIDSQSASTTNNYTVNPQSPGPEAAGGTTSVGGHQAKVVNKHAKITLRCSSAGACSGTLVIRRTNGKGKHRKTVVIGRGRYSLNAGQTKKVSVKLTKKGNNLLNHNFGRLQTKLKVTPNGGSQFSWQLTLKKNQGSGKAADAVLASWLIW